MKDDLEFIQLAIDEARAAALRDEVPVGAVLVDAAGNLIAQNGNRILELSDPTAHAEILVIREAAQKYGVPRLPDLTLYVSLEPCAMCAQAAALARIKRIVFAADDPKGGGVLHGSKVFTQTTCHHHPVIDHGVMADEAGDLLRDFFRKKRETKNQEKKNQNS